MKFLSHAPLSDPMDCSLPGSSVHWIFQARILEWVASAFSICPSQYIIYWNKLRHCILLLVMLTLITWLNGVSGSSLFNVNISPFIINKYFVKKYFKLYKYPISHQSLILASTDGLNNMSVGRQISQILLMCLFNSDFNFTYSL